MIDLLLPLLILAAYAVFLRFLWRETHGLASMTSQPFARRGQQPPSEPERILFVCTHNSARSQMAEALLREAAGTRFIVASAGTAPTHVHPLADQIMEERASASRRTERNRLPTWEPAGTT
jgi:hypothetical protein